MKTPINWKIENNELVKEYTFKNFKEALEFVLLVGELAEICISQGISCPNCKSNSLEPYHKITNTPSLDITCSECNIKIEVKSKCLSTEVLPEDITIKHGSYNNFENKMSTLNMIILIYSVNRLEKNKLTIREILYIPSNSWNNENIKYERREKNLTTIYIKNRLKLSNLIKNINYKFYTNQSKNVKDTYVISDKNQFNTTAKSLYFDTTATFTQANLKKDPLTSLKLLIEEKSKIFPVPRLNLNFCQTL
jgi:hypothetical protein